MKNTNAEIEKMRGDALVSHLTFPSSVKLHLRVEFKIFNTNAPKKIFKASS